MLSFLYSRLSLAFVHFVNPILWRPKYRSRLLIVVVDSALSGFRSLSLTLPFLASDHCCRLCPSWLSIIVVDSALPGFRSLSLTLAFPGRLSLTLAFPGRLLLTLAFPGRLSLTLLCQISRNRFGVRNVA
jgi:hypothetical protein